MSANPARRPVDLPPAPLYPDFDFVNVPPPVIHIPKFDLPGEDGVPMETIWHRLAMTLLLDIIHQLFKGRTDFFAGGNMFIYYGAQQTKSWSYRGPDFFYVADVDGTKKRRYWLSYEEENRLPDVIIELLSPSTRKHDLTTKKDIYERTFRTPDYFCYDPDEQLLLGWTLERARYAALQLNDKGWLWCEQLGVWLGTWEGTYLGRHDVWLRFYDKDGKLLPTTEEAGLARTEAQRKKTKAARKRAETEKKRAETEKKRAEAESERAEAERQRAEAAEAELAWLKASLKKQKNYGHNNH